LTIGRHKRIIHQEGQDVAVFLEEVYMAAPTESRPGAATEILLKLTRIDGTLANISGVSRGMFTILIVALVLNVTAVALLGIVYVSNSKDTQALNMRIQSLETRISGIEGGVTAIGQELKKKPEAQAGAGASGDAETLKLLQQMLKGYGDIYKDLGSGK
jgi:hypothetical protein